MKGRREIARVEGVSGCKVLEEDAGAIDRKEDETLPSAPASRPVRPAEGRGKSPDPSSMHLRPHASRCSSVISAAGALLLS